MASLRSMATVSGFTAVSRVLGFLRDMLIARYVGTGLVGDAFFAAFRFPNMFRRIFGEGAFNAAFVPLYGRKLEQQGHTEALRFANNAFSTLLWVLGIFTVIAIPCMSWLMMAVVPGFKAKVSEDLGALRSGNGAFEVIVKTRGAREIYFQVSAGSAGATAAWANRLRILNPALVRKEGRSARDLFGSDPAGGEAVTVNETAFTLGGLRADGVAIAIDPSGVGRISLPREHNYVAFTGRIEVGSGDAIPGAAAFRIYRNHPGTFDLAVQLSRITFIYLLCMALAAHLSGVLNTMKIFAMPAAAPIILNLVFLCGIGLIGWRGWLPGPVLAWSVAVAGVLQLGALWVTCLLKGVPVHPALPRFDGEMRRLFGLMGPGVVSASIQQVNLLIGGIIASFQAGAVSFLYYAERIYQLPLGMIGIALGVVLLPTVTRQLRSGREDLAIRSIRNCVELAVIITLPAAVAMIVIAAPIIKVLFEHGKFDADSTAQTARALMGFAVGLPAYVLTKVLQPGYYARENTKSPMIMAAITVAVNIVFSLALFPFFKHVGIALATSIAGWVNVVLLASGLHRDGYFTIPRSSFMRLWKTAMASAVMAAVLLGLRALVGGWMDGESWRPAGALVILVAGGAGAYGVLVLALRATTLAEMRAGFRSG